MNRFYGLFLLLIFILTSCSETITSKNELNEKFDAFKEEFLLDNWEKNPDWASGIGLHDYSANVNLYTEEYRQKLISSYADLRIKLKMFKLSELSDGNKIDYYLIENFIDKEEWNIQEFKSYEWNPSVNNIAGRVWKFINGNYTDLDSRLKSLTLFLDKTAAYYRAGVENLKTPTLEHLKIALIQNRGGLKLFNESLSDSINVSGLNKAEKDLLLTRISSSKKAIQNYITVLEEIQGSLNTSSAKSTRIGKEQFFRKFKLVINSNYTAKEIYNKALKEKANLHAQMIDITESLWTKYLPSKKKPSDKISMVKILIDKISEKHVKREDFFKEINRQIPILAAFVKENDLLTQDPTKPLIVRETPLYMRGGGSGASVSSPGPYEKGGKTYYNVTPLDSYTEEEAESYLREYNHYILQILNIHEAIPGHYTQLVYGNQSPSIIKSIFGNGAMIEGWANYTEIMMLEEGYNNSPEMWLMRNKWHLRGVTNTILDYSYHVLNLEKEEGMRLMIKDAFQEQTEAENKWRRTTLSSVQLSSYFTGFTQIYELRDEIKLLKGDAFNLKEFHEHFLSYGNAPVKHIRELMIGK